MDSGCSDVAQTMTVTNHHHVKNTERNFEKEATTLLDDLALCTRQCRFMQLGCLACRSLRLANSCWEVPQHRKQSWRSARRIRPIQIAAPSFVRGSAIATTWPTTHLSTSSPLLSPITMHGNQAAASIRSSSSTSQRSTTRARPRRWRTINGQHEVLAKASCHTMS